MITFVCWKWRDPTYRTRFHPVFVNIFAAMLARHYRAPHRLICVTDDPVDVQCETFPLWKDHGKLRNPSGACLPSCYRRLKLFDVATTRAMGIEDDERVVSMDLDVVMISDLVPLFETEVDFQGWKGIGSWRPVVYNGSLSMFRAGRLQKLWDEFDPVQSPKQTREAKYFGSDQAWISYRMNGTAPGWDRPEGVYSYARDVHPIDGKPLPANARLIFFNGKRKPWERQTQRSAPWIARHWRA